jgi:(p)ppGpp synthase/HD superfamily hydrolase
MATLERAIAIAAKAHEGQVDKAGAPYILHPLRVMLRVATTEERIAAVLHDVVEDTDITIDKLQREGFSEAVLRAIESLSKLEGEAYEAFVERAAVDPIGRVVKLADLAENSDLSRILSPTDKDRERVEKYRRAIKRIKAFADK